AAATLATPASPQRQPGRSSSAARGQGYNESPQRQARARQPSGIQQWRRQVLQYSDRPAPVGNALRRAWDPASPRLPTELLPRSGGSSVAGSDRIRSGPPRSSASTAVPGETLPPPPKASGRRRGSERARNAPAGSSV